ncbi:MAG: DNA cytosine methyltransferase [Geobacter sp.]
MKIDAVDLFCGAGGLSYGLQKTGISVRAGIDFDAQCEFPFTTNIKGALFFLEDITTTDANKIRRLYRKKSLKLLAGCAPCQPFSSLRNGSNKSKSDKWPLLNEFSRLVSQINPDFVTMENVPQLKKQSIFHDFIDNLKQHGYQVFAQIVDAADYGVPQRRNRLVLLASLHGPIRLLSPEEIGVKRKTVRDAIGQLPPVKAGETHHTDPLHKARALSSLNLDRIRASQPGGTWEDWPDHLKLECHKKETGATFKSVYGRMQWDLPSGTITTQSTNFGTGRFGHPSQDRALSLREIAILQSFPPDYIFTSNKSEIEFTSLGRLIGNAVPVDLGYAVGRSLTQHAHSIGRKYGKQAQVQA